MNKQVKTSELSGSALDWAVAKCEGYSKDTSNAGKFAVRRRMFGLHQWSTSWQLAGPIIEREGITTVYCSGNLGEPRTYWVATSEMQGWDWGYGPYHEQDEDKSLQIYAPQTIKGPTPLIAAMRCYVASKLGDVVEIPEELLI